MLFSPFCRSFRMDNCFGAFVAYLHLYMDVRMGKWIGR